MPLAGAPACRLGLDAARHYAQSCREELTASRGSSRKSANSRAGASCCSLRAAPCSSAAARTVEQAIKATNTASARCLRSILVGVEGVETGRRAWQGAPGFVEGMAIEGMRSASTTDGGPSTVDKSRPSKHGAPHHPCQVSDEHDPAFHRQLHSGWPSFSSRDAS